jgi:hypothetical protein
VGLLIPFGAPPVLTAAAGLVFEAITTIGGLIAGVVAFLMGRISSGQTRPFPGLSAFPRDENTTP